MASARFTQVAFNHWCYHQDPPTSTWDDAKVDAYSGPPRNYVTDDEGEAIKATDGIISSSWYDYQHALGVAGIDMPPDPNYSQFAAIEGT